MVHDFIKDKKWPMTETGTGLNYWIYENGKGAKAELEMFATISYTVSNFDGVEIYKSEPANPGMFKIGMDNVESGLHEVIVLMKVGDKAKVVLPSHLAFGLTGDSSKIPHSTPLVYDIQLIDLQ
jgi:FKBP-type peptidyl-prolyl cis-trans isomerase